MGKDLTNASWTGTLLSMEKARGKSRQREAARDDYAVLYIRLNHADHKRIARAAETQRLAASAWARMVLLEKVSGLRPVGALAAGESAA